MRKALRVKSHVDPAFSHLSLCTAGAQTKMEEMEMDVVGTTGESEGLLLPQVDGVTLQKGTCRIWGKIWASQARPDDLVIASYPKAGMWWPREQESPRVSSEWAMQRPPGALSVNQTGGQRI